MTVPNMGNFKIVGISKLQSPCIYTDKSLFINLIANAQSADEIQEANYGGEDKAASAESAAANILDYQLKTSEASLKSGSWQAKTMQDSFSGTCLFSTG